ncbi:MAG: hypothetical protein Q4F41_11705 [Eubacteriales bacterium]|nr:hypothetical protein [Eubacteriales bacterium]
MAKKTRIVVLKKRELIYTGIFAALAIALIVLLVFMFLPREEASSRKQTPITSTRYVPGVYTTPVTLGDQAVDVEVTVDADHINGIRLVNLSETVTTMFPLMEPAMESLAAQICESQSLDGITCDSGSQYTSQVLLKAVQEALAKAEGTVSTQ